MKRKIFVFGRGFLGNYVVKEFRKHGDEVFSSRLTKCSKDDFKIDICDKNAVFQILEKLKPDLIINCVAITDLDFLEDNPEKGFEINSEGAKNLALASTKYNTKLIHISTDGLFDGETGMYKENDSPNPINIYAKTKLLAEKYVIQEAKNYLILRTNFIGCDPEGNNLLNWIISKLSKKETIIGFSDILFTPIEVSYLSSLIYKLSSISKNLILNLSSDQKISKYDLAILISELFSFDKKLIKTGLSSDIYLKAKRPKDSSLSNKNAKEFLNEDFLSLNDSLKRIKSKF
jgi:dTDP-4-dehydrorhamnose reductase